MKRLFIQNEGICTRSIASFYCYASDSTEINLPIEKRMKNSW